MPLTKPPLTPVTAGEPVTAQGWNELVDGLSDLYDAVIALGGGTLEVAVTANTDAVPGATVVAEPLGEGRASAALPPFGARTAHLLVGLTDGPWRVHVHADGFNPEFRDVTMPHADPLPVPLTLAGVAVPDLFGHGARAALDELVAAGIDANLLLDTTGREISRTALPPEYVDSPVLHQLPAAGTVVPAGTGQVRLLVASALRREPVVTMPSLVGLSLTEAKEVLDRIGLTLGETSLRG
jgi:hypothetical protein